MKIHFIIPSNNPTYMKTIFLPSLKEFVPIKDIVSFGLTLQQYSAEDVKFVEEEFAKFDIELHYICKEYQFEKGYTPLLRMRDDAAMLNPTADFYCFLDDDNSFSDKYKFAIADVVKDILAYFDKYPKCGSIMISLYKPQGIIHANIENDRMETTLGLFLRNIYPEGHIIPEKMLDLSSMGEDRMCIRKRYTNGYFSAICNAICGNHKDMKPQAEEGRFKYGWMDAAKNPLPGTILHYVNTHPEIKTFNWAPMILNKTVPPDFPVTRKKNLNYQECVFTKKLKIHFVIPTINPDYIKTRLLPSLLEFIPVRDIVSFGLVFQKYSDADIDLVKRVFAMNGITLYSIKKEYNFEKGYPPLIQMRDDAAMLNPTADIYGIIDDDSFYSYQFPFAIADIIRGIVRYYEKYPKCGSIMINTRQPHGYIQPNTNNYSMWTNLGLFVRNIYEDGHLMPKHLLSLIGRNQDLICVQQRSVDGYFDAICNTPCGIHFAGKPESEQGLNKYGWKDVEDVDGTIRYHMKNHPEYLKFDWDKFLKENELPSDYPIPPRYNKR